MKISPPKNPNYVATVIRVPNLEKLEGLDNLVALRAFGMQALVGKNTKVGDIGILFSTEVQLSDDFCKANNLYRHSNLNDDPNAKGYLEDNRRIKAIRLKGHRSDSLFVSLHSFSYLGISPNDFRVGDVFDSIDGNEICKKYLVREPRPNKNTAPKIRKVDEKNFPVHFDTENYWRNAHKIPQGAQVIVTQKLHGTSIRFGRIQVARDLKWYEKLAQKLGIKVQQTESRFVVGSRMVVKSLDGQTDIDKNHFYAEDEWTKFLYSTTIPDVIPEGFLVYGELIGYTSDGGAIQKNYTYDLAPGKAALYVYRVATISPTGIVVDLPWEQVKQFCKDHGMKWCPELSVGDHGTKGIENRNGFEDTWINAYMDKRYADDIGVEHRIFNYINIYTHRETPVPLSNSDTVDEGVCIRYEGPFGPFILKAKSPIFLGHESKLLDSGTEDMESQEAVSEEAVS